MNRLDKRNIPERLQEIKDMNSWSSQEMAMKANVTLPTIRNALEGLSALKSDTLIKVAEGLGVSLDMLCGNCHVKDYEYQEYLRLRKKFEKKG